MAKVGINKKYPKREVNIRKDENMSHIVKKVVTKTNTNATKNIGVQNKTVTECWDQQMSKTMVYGYEKQTSAEYMSNALIPTEIAKKLRKEIEDEKKSKKLLEKNMEDLILKIETIKSNANEQLQVDEKHKFKIGYPMKYDTNAVVDTMMTEIDKINSKLNMVTAELSSAKNNNNALMESITAALNKYQTLESIQKMQEDISYKEKLDKVTKDLENTLTEKIDILNRLESSEIALSNANEKIDILLKVSVLKKEDHNKNSEASNSEHQNWNDYGKEKEKEIIELKNTLARKEEYIKHQEYESDNLTRENQIVREDYQNRIQTLSDIMEELKNKFTESQISYDNETATFRDTLKIKENKIAEMEETVQRQNKVIDYLKKTNITMGSHDGSLYTLR